MDGRMMYKPKKPKPKPRPKDCWESVQRERLAIAPPIYFIEMLHDMEQKARDDARRLSL